jgi:hypothetical protein
MRSFLLEEMIGDDSRSVRRIGFRASVGSDRSKFGSVDFGVGGPDIFLPDPASMTVLHPATRKARPPDLR